MVDTPLTLATLAEFHREVLIPEVRQVVREEVAREVGGLRDEMHTAFDALAQRLDRLETEYHMLVAGVERIEERLNGVEVKLDRAALKADVLALKARVEALERQLGESDG